MDTTRRRVAALLVLQNGQGRDAAIRRVVFPSVQKALERAIKDKGVSGAITLYRLMKQRYPAEYFRESTLNTLGYQQLNGKHTQEAIALFNRFVCPNCAARLARDLKSRGFVRHLERPLRDGAALTAGGYCALDRGGKDRDSDQRRAFS